MIPFLDLRRQLRSIRAEIDEAVSRVLDSAQFILGPEVETFEREFAAYCGAPHAVGCNSGTSALHLALLAADVGPGDEVITVPFTFVATTAAIRYTGATPVFVDIEPCTFNMDPELVERAITPRTKALLPVHLFGHPADMDPLVEIARRHGLVLIEDAAQAHGAEYKGRRVGSIGDFGCFSFYPGKNLGAFGEGGLVTTRDAGAAEKLRLLRNWGSARRYHYTMQAYNYRLDALQAAILRVKLRHLEAWTEARREHARAYNELLAGVVTTPVEAAGCRHVYAVYAIRTPRRDAVEQAFSRSGIGSVIYYPIPIHLTEAHADLGYQAGQFPCSEQAAAEQLSLPVFPELQPDERAEIARVVVHSTRN